MSGKLKRLRCASFRELSRRNIVELRRQYRVLEIQARVGETRAMGESITKSSTQD